MLQQEQLAPVLEPRKHLLSKELKLHHHWTSELPRYDAMAMTMTKTIS